MGDIALVLAGAFPLVWTITKVFRKPLLRLGHLLGMNDTAAGGLIASLANSIAMFGMVKDMDQRGKVINVAFAVSAAFVFGDHLGFTAGFDPEMLLSVIVGKLVAASPQFLWQWPLQEEKPMTKTELERAVRAILMEQLGAPQVLSLDLPRVQVDESDRLDTGNPNDRVWTHDLLTCPRAPGWARV